VPSVAGKTITALGTFCSLLVSCPSALNAAQRILSAELAAIDLACSRFRADSELTSLNRTSGRRVAVSATLWRALEVALRAAEASDGDVDPTCGRSLIALGYDRDFAELARNTSVLTGPPAPAAGWQCVDLDPVRRTVRVPPGVLIDLGATAKALAADLAAHAIWAGLATGVLVNLGGDISIAGQAPQGGWRVGVDDGVTEARESAATPAVVRQVTTVPETVLAQVRGGGTITPLQPVKRPGPALMIGGKLAIVFVSEESCPFCAAERWPLAVALSHFGTWSHLGATRSSPTDVFPNTATLSFRSASYRSSGLTLRTTELTDNRGRRLQPLTALDTTLIRRYDVPPYVNSAAQSGAVPFLDIGNRYILAGAQYSPQVLAGLSQAQIASQLRDPASPVAQAIDGSAKVIIAAIDNVLHDRAPA